MSEERKPKNFYIATPAGPSDGHTVQVQNFKEGKRMNGAGYNHAATIQCYNPTEAVNIWLNGKGLVNERVTQRVFKGTGDEYWQMRWQMQWEEA